MKLFSKSPNKDTNSNSRQPGRLAGRAPVYSYHSVRDSRLGEQHREGSQNITTPQNGLVHKMLSVFCWSLVILIMGFELWLKPIPKTTIASLPGTVSRPQQAYSDGIRDIWGQSLLNNSKLTIQSDKLKTDIKQRFPELSGVDIELPLLGQLPNVILTPSSPALLLVTQRGVFYLDADGKTLGRTDQVTPNALGGLPTARDDSGLVPEPGKNGLPKQTIQTVSQLLRLAASANLDVDTLTLPPAPNEVDMLIRGSNYVVKFAFDQDPRQGIGALLALRDKFKSDNIQPSTYVDLRVPDKAFYK